MWFGEWLKHRPDQPQHIIEWLESAGVKPGESAPMFCPADKGCMLFAYKGMAEKTAERIAKEYPEFQEKKVTLVSQVFQACLDRKACQVYEGYLEILVNQDLLVYRVRMVRMVNQEYLDLMGYRGRSDKKESQVFQHLMEHQEKKEILDYLVSLVFPGHQVLREIEDSLEHQVSQA